MDGINGPWRRGILRPHRQRQTYPGSHAITRRDVPRIYRQYAQRHGMNPYAFTSTSHLAVSAALALFTIGLVVVAGIWKNGLKWFKIFAPAGLPLPMYLLIIPIEIISFLSRPITLAVRLFANMTAGHVMLKIFAIFIAYLMGSGGWKIFASIVPILGTAAIVALEFLVAGLQAFVFAILTCVYLNDVYHVDH